MTTPGTRRKLTRGQVIFIALFAVCSVVAIIASIATRPGPADPGDAIDARVDPTTTLCIQWTHTAKLNADAPAPAHFIPELTTDAETATAKWLVKKLGAKDTSPAFAQDFVTDITTACQADGMQTVGDIAAGLAALDTADFN